MVLDLDKLFSRCTVLCFSLVRTAAKAFIFRGENSGRLERASPIFFSTQTEIRPRACDLASPAHHFSVALPRIFYRSILVRLQTQLAFCYHRPRLWFCRCVFLFNWISVLSHFLGRARREFSDCRAPVDFPPSMIRVAFCQIYFHGLAWTHFLCVWISRPYYS
jgi:hypothetical protein